ncbi:MAG: hypothetical protein ABI467_15895 [Kofleriaceae bacterium]
MKATKFIVLVGGILGLLSFFLPLVSVHRANATGQVSAFQIMKGLDTVSVAVDEASVHSVAEVETRSQAQQGVGAMKGIVMAIFAPALLLTLIGGLGVSRKRFGRSAAAFSLIFGLVGLGIGAILTSAAEGHAGIGMTLLLVTGIAGVVGGLLGLVKPERLIAATAGYQAAAA